MSLTCQLGRYRHWAFTMLLVSLPAFPLGAGAEDSYTAVRDLAEIRSRLKQCTEPLTVPHATTGLQATVRLEFNGRGEILGTPRFTYVSSNVAASVRTKFKAAIMEALGRCTPLPFAAKLGGVIAGVPIILRFDEHGLTLARLAGQSAPVPAPALPSYGISPASPVPPLVQAPVQQPPPIWVPGVPTPIPSLPHGPESSQDRRSRCAFQSGLYGVPPTKLSQYMGLCTQ